MKNFLSFLLVLTSTNFFSQVSVNCASNLVYFNGNPIQVYNPLIPISASNPSNTSIPNFGNGLALCNNLNSGTLSPTFYTILGGNIYYYWDGFTWVSTGHTTPSTQAVNPTGAGCYIYNLAGQTGDVYKYDGLSNGTFFMNIPGFATGGPYDVSSDFDGNFYILRTDTNQWLKVYDFSGILTNSFAVTGMPFIKAGGGLAVLGNTVYVSNANGLFTGLINGTVVNFSLTSTSIGAGDFANCPSMNTGTISYSVYNTGPLNCSGSTVIASGFSAGTTYSWSGPGLAGPPTNSSVPVTSSGLYICIITPPSGCNSVLSTSVSSSGPINISIVPTLTTICQGGTANVSVIGATSYTWSPSTGLSSTSGNSVVANPTLSTTYTVTGSTGTCTSTPKTINVNVAVCTAVEEANKKISEINVYPNPNNGEFIVHSIQEIDLQIINGVGKMVRSISLTNQNNFEIKISNLPAGLYLIIDTKGKSVKNKIVVAEN